ncbi:putative pre-mRNA splicing factor [Astrocystis sublimbata]|nr:putative pre-mRNA splicing factor [Astrocystis sublimbata]
MATPLGEADWIAYLDEQKLLARSRDLESRIKVVELYKAAIGDEPGSLHLWLGYCQYFWSLFTECQTVPPSSSSSASPSPSPGTGSWTDDDRRLGRDLFSFDAALSLWGDGYDAVKFRISDSHELWDRWIHVELDQLARTRHPTSGVNASGVKRISHLFRDRLQVPHRTWDETSQMFSQFLTTYNNAAYEQEMQDVTRTAHEAKTAYEQREAFEIGLARAPDHDAEKEKMRQYLDWEMTQTAAAISDVASNSTANARHHPRQPDRFAIPLGLGLYARALTTSTLFAFDDEIWNNCAVHISSLHRQAKAHPSLYTPLLPNMLDFFQRATKHCPWAGPLWSRYILTAEDAGLAFHNVESIKHAATNTKALDKNGMTGVLDMYTAWCGFLKRTAMNPNAHEDAADVADVGLLAALEDVELWGKRLYKDMYQGDPNFRLERILIQFLTEVKGDPEAARSHWDRMSRQSLLANSYDFWLNYYLWEMVVYASRTRGPSPTPPTPSAGTQNARIPTLATGVLQRALTQKSLDWPERIMEVYLQHCNDYEVSETLHFALDTVHKTRRRVEKRRVRENAAANAAYATQLQAQNETENAKEIEQTPDVDVTSNTQDTTIPGSPSGAKRKRGEETNEDADAASHKKVRSTESHGDEAESADAKPKRDRENTSVMVTNLPSDVTQTAVRKYFHPYGHINNLVLHREGDEKSSSALIEFRSSEEADSALLRDQKYFNQSKLDVQPGTRLTLFVSNYPPTADEAYLRRLFKHCGDIFNIRWPSLKYNTHRRFCYVSFRTTDASRKATLMDGTMVEGKYKLQSKYSDPSHKKDREGALAEGREVRVKGVHPSTEENDLRSIFGKYGKVVSLRFLTKLSGQPIGTAYVVFQTKEQAENALQLDKTKFKSQLLEVELCKESNYRPLATSRGERGTSDTASPAPSADGDVTMADGDDDDEQAGAGNKGVEIRERTMAILDVPDTINDARVRSLAEKYGSIVKLVLRPDHAGATVEFADVAAVGRASLGIEGYEIIPGRKLRTGSVRELFAEKGEKKPSSNHSGGRNNKDKDGTKTTGNANATAKEKWMPPPVAVRRPVLGGRRGGRGGRMGALGFVAAATATAAANPDVIRMSAE